MLCIARTLAGNPRAILLDEPSEGLAPRRRGAGGARPSASSRRAGVAVLLAEQSRHFADRVADRAYVLEKGVMRRRHETRPASHAHRAAAGDGGGIQRLVRRASTCPSAWRSPASARRVAGCDCPTGDGKYLATYELDSPAVLQSPPYLARFRNQTPWSRRCLGKAWCSSAGRASRSSMPIRTRTARPWSGVRHTSPIPVRQYCNHGGSPPPRARRSLCTSSPTRDSLATMPTASTNLERYAWLSVAAALATIGLKTLAWWLTGSVGLLSDALESIVNLAAALLALSMLRLAASPPDENHPYGFSKAEYFSAGIEGALIVLAAAGILATAMPRLIEPQPLEAPVLGLALSAAGLGHQLRGRRAADSRRAPRAQHRARGRRAAPDDRRLDLGRRDRRRGARVRSPAGCASTRWWRSRWRCTSSGPACG